MNTLYLADALCSAYDITDRPETVQMLNERPGGYLSLTIGEHTRDYYRCPE